MTEFVRYSEIPLINEVGCANAGQWLAGLYASRGMAAFQLGSRPIPVFRMDYSDKSECAMNALQNMVGGRVYARSNTLVRKGYEWKSSNQFTPQHALKLITVMFPYTPARRRVFEKYIEFESTDSKTAKWQIALSAQQEKVTETSIPEYLELLESDSFEAGLLASSEFLERTSNAANIKIRSLNYPLLDALQIKNGGNVLGSIYTADGEAADAWISRSEDKIRIRTLVNEPADEFGYLFRDINSPDQLTIPDVNYADSLFYELSLSPKEHQLLCILASNPDVAISYEVLKAALNISSKHALQNLFGRMRQKLPIDDGDFIEVVTGKGLRYLGPTIPSEPNQ